MAVPLTTSLLASAALLLLAGCSTESRPDGNQPMPARVLRIKGSARWAKAEGLPWQVLKRGDILTDGAVIETGMDESRVDIRLGEPAGPHNNMVRLWENSWLRIDRLALKRRKPWALAAEEVHFHLSAGHMFGAVPKLSEDSSYVIEFGSCVARIQGTVYAASADGVVKVLVGSVSVTWPGSPKPQVVMGEQQFDARTGVLTSLAGVDYNRAGHLDRLP